MYERLMLRDLFYDRICQEFPYHEHQFARFQASGNQLYIEIKTTCAGMMIGRHASGIATLKFLAKLYYPNYLANFVITPHQKTNSKWKKKHFRK